MYVTNQRYMYVSGSKLAIGKNVWLLPVFYVEKKM